MKSRAFSKILRLALIGVALLPSAALANAYPVEVRVVDANGRGIPNVSVAACEIIYASMTCSKPIATARSRSDGTATVKLISGHYKGGLVYVEVVEQKYFGNAFLMRIIGDRVEPFTPFGPDPWGADPVATVCSAFQPLRHDGSVTIVPGLCGISKHQ